MKMLQVFYQRMLSNIAVTAIINVIINIIGFLIGTGATTAIRLRVTLLYFKSKINFATERFTSIHNTTAMLIPSCDITATK